MYLATCTRPDIAYAVGMHCRNMSTPTPELMREVDYIFAYLARNRSIGLTYDTSKGTLSGMTDASLEEGRSTSGYLVRWQGAVLSWGSTKQKSTYAVAAAVPVRSASGAKNSSNMAALMGAAISWLSLGTLDFGRWLTSALLPACRRQLPGFAQMEEEMIEWLNRRYGTVVELFYAHGLRQSPRTLQSTGFDVHQDTEDFDFIEYTYAAHSTLTMPHVTRFSLCRPLANVLPTRAARVFALATVLSSR